MTMSDIRNGPVGPSITAESLVQDVVEQYPHTVLVFGRHGLQCVGCYISPFHTVADSAREYAMALDLLLADLNQTIANRR
jgi:hybrid cluster-associated redox disulfide protein